MGCLRYRYMSQFGGVDDMTKLQVYVTVGWGFLYFRDTGIFLL